MTERRISFDDIMRNSHRFSETHRFGDHYMCARLKNTTQRFTPLHLPVRFDCMTIIFCRRGSFNVELNLQPYAVKPGSFVFVGPTMLFRLTSFDAERVDASLIFISLNFIADINLDLNTFNLRSLIRQHSPLMQVDETEYGIFRGIYGALEAAAANGTHSVFTRNVARSLCASLIYQLLQFNYARISRQAEKTEGAGGRRQTYVQEFMRLVHLNYLQQRSVSFYADKLHITPKYLTILVREFTGRSAAEWINDFVIIEAKNLLRFSGKNVQQVAYALNFSSQSAFGKYFKHLTGISPTDYQKS